MRLILVVIFVLMTGCDNCRNLDCIPTFDSFQFIYVDSNGNDLLSGTPPKYEFEDLRVYSFDSNNNKVFANLYSSATAFGINVQLTYLTERSFLEVKGDVTDTLDFEFKTRKTECCGHVSEIDETTLNGVVYNGDFPIEITER